MRLPRRPTKKRLNSSHWRFPEINYFFIIWYFIIFIFVGADLCVCPYMIAQLIFPYYYEWNHFHQFFIFYSVIILFCVIHFILLKWIHNEWIINGWIWIGRAHRSDPTTYNLFLYACFVFIGCVSIHILTTGSESVLKPICGLDKSSPYKRLFSVATNKLYHCKDKSFQAYCLIYILFMSVVQQGVFIL